jgi:transposase
LTDDQVLQEYKAQQSTQRGFRFLKDPLFFTSSVFLNTLERVAALAMLMGLRLLVYSLGQRSLRQALAPAKQTMDNQVGKPTAKPTCSVGVSMFHVDSFVDRWSCQSHYPSDIGAIVDSPVLGCCLQQLLPSLLSYYAI